MILTGLRGVKERREARADEWGKGREGASRLYNVIRRRQLKYF